MVVIMGISIKNRKDEAQNLQQILTDYGCNIRTRIGLHPIGEYSCSNYGVVLIEVVDKINEIYDLLSKYWEVQTMKF